MQEKSRKGKLRLDSPTVSGEDFEVISQHRDGNSRSSKRDFNQITNRLECRVSEKAGVQKAEGHGAGTETNLRLIENLTFNCLAQPSIENLNFKSQLFG